jgi:hypothetical protein
LLTGSRSLSSWIIRRGTKSDYSHAIAVTGDSELTEANDLTMTPNEDDEGVYGLSYEDLADRADSLTGLKLLRPTIVDTARLSEVARTMRERSPGYPSFGAYWLSAAKWSTDLIRPNDSGQRQRTSRVRKLAGRALHRKLDFIGDGDLRLHCAEFIYRLYRTAGTPVRFARPVLRRSMRWLDIHAGGPAEMGPAIEHPKRRAEPGTWSNHRNPLRRWSSNVVAAGSESAVAARERWTETSAPDHGDFVVPGDFELAEPFEMVDVLDLRRHEPTRTSGSSKLWLPTRRRKRT